MVGCLKYIGEKKWTVKKFTSVIKSKNRNLCAPPAPAEGLFLQKGFILTFFVTHCEFFINSPS
jgi:tRNA pseudouridine38-40 synthase